MTETVTELINRILAWKVFIPLSRLSYMTYLIHPLLLWYFMGALRNLIDASSFTSFFLFFPFFTFSYLSSIAMVLVFESPFLVLQKQLFLYLSNNKDYRDVMVNLTEGDKLLRQRLPLPVAPEPVEKAIKLVVAYEKQKETLLNQKAKGDISEMTTLKVYSQSC